MAIDENKKKRLDEILSNLRSLTQNGTDIYTANMWFKGYDPSFHKYEIYNGTKFVSKTKTSLKMGKRICEDWASLLWSEKLDVAIKDKENLYNLLYKLKFWQKGNAGVELGFALGYSALVVDIVNIEVNEKNEVIKSDKTKIQLSHFSAFNIVPVTVENEEITECAFITQSSKSTNINLHYKDEKGNYCIDVYREDKQNGKEELYTIVTESTTPLFCIIHPNAVNNTQLDNTTDLFRPTSILINAIDTLKAIDNKYDAFDSEFILGKKRVYVSAKLNKIVYEKDENGNEKATYKRSFDGSDQVIYELPESPDGKPLIYSPNDPLRSQDIISGIQTEIQILGAKVGLGNDYYNFEKGRVMTATQVVSEKSDTFRNIKKHELVLENAVRTIVKAIIYCNNTFTNEQSISLAENEEPEIIFDDSIIEDKSTEKENDRKDLESGVMTKVEYRVKWYAEDEKEAEKKFLSEDIASRSTKLLPLLSENAITLKAFIQLAYGEEGIKLCGYKNVDEFVTDLEAKKKSEEISYEDLLAGGNYIPQKSEKSVKKANEEEKENK